MRGTILWLGTHIHGSMVESTPCLDDHQFAKDDFELVGDLAAVCAQIVMNCVYRARIGWSRRAMDCRRSGWSCHNIEQSVRQKGETDKLFSMHFGSSAVLSCRRQSQWTQKLVYYKTLILLDIQQIQSQYPLECTAFFGCSHVCTNVMGMQATDGKRHKAAQKLTLRASIQIPNLQNHSGPINYVSPNAQVSSNRFQVLILEDSETLVNMTINGQSPTYCSCVKNASRIFYWLCDRINLNLNFCKKTLTLTNRSQMAVRACRKAAACAKQWKVGIKITSVATENPQK